MKTMHRAVLTAIALTLFSEMAFAVVTIRGTRSCGQWIEIRDDEKKGVKPITSISVQSWLIGFLSGQALESDKDFWGKEGANSLDNASVFLWMDNYCRANPLKPLNQGADQLFEERTKGMK